MREELDETSNLYDEQDIFPVFEVRVLDETKNTSFRVIRVTRFPVAENMQDMKAASQMLMPDIQHVEDWQLGYVLERDKKCTIETDVELHDAFQHYRDGYHANVVRSNPTKAVAAKRKIGTSVQGCI